MNVKQATKKNRDEWLGMRKVLFSGLNSSYHEIEIERILKDASHTCFILFNEHEEHCGFLEVSLRNVVDGCIESPVGYIEGLFIAPEFRLKGYGELLIDAAATWCVKHGCTSIGTDTEIDNLDAQNYFRNQGFEQKWTIVQFLKRLG